MVVASPPVNVSRPQATGGDAITYWKNRAQEAERDRDYWKNEFYLLRKIRRAPVLKPVTKEILEEFRHVEKWGKVEGPDESKRANYKTIAAHLHTSPDTVKRHAERLEKLGIVDIREYQGPQDEFERKYVHVKEERLATIDQLEDPEEVIPKQGGARIYRCMQPGCDGEMEIRTITRKRTKVMLRCINCHHESILSEDLEDVVEDTDWQQQNGQKAQKQLAEHCVYTPPVEDAPASPTEERVSTLPEQDEMGQKQVAFTPSASHARSIMAPPPEFLRTKTIWVGWRWEVDEEGKRTKVPHIADLLGTRKASHSDPSTWRTYAYAVAAYEKSQTWEKPKPFDGIGFMCDGTFTFLDQDHCRNPETGAIDEAAMERARQVNSYTEPSVSGHGLHTYAEGTVLADRKYQGVEMYSHTRFCVYTGCPLPDFPQTIEYRQDELRALHSAYFPPKQCYTPPDGPEETFTDEELEAVFQEVMAKAPRAKNGERFLKLWNGDMSEYRHPNGTPDHSRADLAFCRMLVYWVGKRKALVDGIFRKSKLYRPKWERDDYREKTLALALCGEEQAVA